MKVNVLLEDEYVLAVEKPSGITVNRSETIKDAKTLQDWVERSGKIQTRREEIDRVDTRGSLDTPEVFYNRSGIVHRLDKETSGILLIAKTPEAFFHLQQQFRERTIKKSYTALVHGALHPDKGEIRAPVGRQTWNRKRFGVIAGGRDAVTRYMTEAFYRWREGQEHEILSLLRLYPETGRTHQIRVHLKFLHCPIVSDELYGGRKTARNDRKKLPRLFLHASEITFFHPMTGEATTLTSPLPEDLGEFIIEYLQKVELTGHLR